MINYVLIDMLIMNSFLQIMNIILREKY